ncbi:hypothetical protein BSLG_005939 [Batrachochytrium salamandrivorans]|nr:hypothetical protein BSLG_005939 [Batrachochytrium salamandrivorans]
MSRIIVVGGGLASLSAAHTVLERGGSVLLLDKNAFLGGNSTKATSGINGAGTATQIKLGIPDNSQIFYEDSAKSARAEIVLLLTKVLTYQSGSAGNGFKTNSRSTYPLCLVLVVTLIHVLIVELSSFLHYMGRGLMKHYKGAAAVSQDTGMPLKNLESTFSTYNNIAKTKNDPFVFIVYCLPNHVLTFQPSSVHGANRLGGSSLGCVVYGRVAGATAAAYLMNQFSAERRLGAVAGHLAAAPVTVTVEV